MTEVEDEKNGKELVSLLVGLALLGLPNSASRSQAMSSEENGSANLAVSTYVEPSEQAEALRLVYISDLAAYLDIRNGVAYLMSIGSVEGGRYFSLGMSLQKRSGSGWTDVALYGTSAYGSLTYYQNYALSSGGDYRVKATLSCSGEVATSYSLVKSY